MNLPAPRTALLGQHSLDRPALSVGAARRPDTLNRSVRVSATSTNGAPNARDETLARPVDRARR